MSSKIEPFDRAIRRIAAEYPPIKHVENEIALRRLFQLGVEEGMKQVDNSVARLRDRLYIAERKEK